MSPSQKKPKEHWTKVLYVDHPELYLPILEGGREVGGAEAENLAAIFRARGFSKGKILDLGCGTGRHSIPLAKLGYEVVGYDISPLFIERAKERAKAEKLDETKVRFYEGDTRNIAEVLSQKKEGGFNIVLSLFSSLGSYGDQEDLDLIKTLFELAEPNCLLLIETINRDFMLKRFQSFGIHGISQKIRLLDIAKFNLETSMLEDQWRFYTETSDGNMWLELDVEITGRVYTLHELKKLTSDGGWKKYVASYGSLISPGPLNLDSPSIVLICQKA